MKSPLDEFFLQDREAIEAAVRLREQLDLFPDTLVSGLAGTDAFAVDHRAFADAMLAVSLASEIRESGRLTCTMHGGVLVWAARQREMEAWSRIGRQGAPWEGDCLSFSVSHAVAARIAALKERPSMRIQIVRDLADRHARELRVKLGTAKISLSIGYARPDLPPDLLDPTGKFDPHLTSTALASALRFLSVLPGHDQLVRFKDGALVAGGASGMFAVQTPELSSFDFIISAADAKPLARILRRMRRGVAHFSRTEEHVQFEDGLLVARVPSRQGSSMPGVVALSQAPPEATFSPIIRQVGLCAATMSIASPTRIRIGVPEERGLPLRADTPGGKAFAEVWLKGLATSGAWTPIIVAAAPALLFSFGREPGTFQWELLKKGKLLRLTKTEDSYRETLILPAISE